MFKGGQAMARLCKFLKGKNVNQNRDSRRFEKIKDNKGYLGPIFSKSSLELPELLSGETALTGKVSPTKRR